MKVKADREMCMGSGNCVVECPEVFGLDQANVVVILDEQPAAKLRDRVELAVDACPAACLELED